MLISRLSVIGKTSPGLSVERLVGPALDFLKEIKVAYDLGLGFIPSGLAVGLALLSLQLPGP
jgi:hypothetical protein